MAGAGAGTEIVIPAPGSRPGRDPGRFLHLFKMTLEESNICPLCETEEETVGHFLGKCPALSMKRGKYFNCFYASMTEIFESNNILKIVGYAKSTRRLDYEDKDDSGVT